MVYQIFGHWLSLLSLKSWKDRDSWDLFCAFMMMCLHIESLPNVINQSSLARGSPCRWQSFSPLQAQEGTEGPGTQLNFSRFPMGFLQNLWRPQGKRRNLRLTPVKRFVALFPQEVSSLRSELRAKGNEVVVAGCSWPYFLTCFWEFHWKQLHHTGDDRSISDQINKNDKKLKGKVSACAFFFSLKPITFFCDDHGDPCWIIHRWWAKLPSARRHQPSRKLWALQGRVCLPCCCILQDGL